MWMVQVTHLIMMQSIAGVKQRKRFLYWDRYISQVILSLRWLLTWGAFTRALAADEIQLALVMHAWSYCDRFICVFQHIIPKPTIICFFKLKCNVSQFLGNDFPADITEMSLLSNDKFICKKTYKNNVVQTLWKLRFTQCHSSILCPLIKIQKNKVPTFFLVAYPVFSQ